jgi:hypothetical protein
MPRPEALELTRLLAAMTSTPAKPSELAKTLGVSRATVHRRLETALQEALVVRVGEGPAAAYRKPTVAEEVARSRSTEITSGQVRLVIGANTAYAMQSLLELFSRIGIGQFNEIASRARFTELKHADGTPLDYDQLDELDKLADMLKVHLLGLHPNASHGIYSPNVHPDVQRTWALQRALRHRIAWDRQPQGSMGVWHDEPLTGDHIVGLFVHSDGRDDKEGFPTRYVMEMPRDCVQLLHDALHASLNISLGDVSALIQLARDGMLRDKDGAVPSAKALDDGEVIAARMQQVISGVEGSKAYNAQMSKSQAEVFEVVNALRQFLQTQEPASCSGASEQGTRVEPVGDSPWAATVEDMPEGMLLNFQKGKYRVIAPTGEDKMLTIIAESHSLKTAVQMARNWLDTGRGRNFTM